MEYPSRRFPEPFRSGDAHSLKDSGSPSTRRFAPVGALPPYQPFFRAPLLPSGPSEVAEDRARLAWPRRARGLPARLRQRAADAQGHPAGQPRKEMPAMPACNGDAAARLSFQLSENGRAAQNP